VYHLFGSNVSDSWKNLVSGKSGISNITSVNTSDLDVHFGGEIKKFRCKRLDQ
jgi:3-oxoacyl-(acyl-carrier-protein) synthase